jgi:hypothetical protein
MSDMSHAPETVPEDGALEERDGLLVILGAIKTADADHRLDREARLDQLAVTWTKPV